MLRLSNIIISVMKRIEFRMEQLRWSLLDQFLIKWNENIFPKTKKQQSSFNSKYNRLSLQLAFFSRWCRVCTFIYNFLLSCVPWNFRGYRPIMSLILHGVNLFEMVRKFSSKCKFMNCDTKISSRPNLHTNSRGPWQTTNKKPIKLYFFNKP